MKKKATTRQLPELERINQVMERLQLFIEICGKTKTPENAERMDGQITAFGVAIVLLRQVKKRGELWKGGYLDNVGVVYTDQVQAFLDNLNDQEEDQE